MSVEAFDLTQQALWEAASVKEAVERYRREVSDSAVYERASGRRVLKETVQPIAEVLGRRQEEAVRSGVGKPPAWCSTVLSLAPDTLAVIGVSTVLRAPVTVGARVGYSLTMYGRLLAPAIQDQIEFEKFAAEQQAAQRAATKDLRQRIAAARSTGRTSEEADLKAELGEIQHDRLLRLFQKTHPDADRRAWRRFAKRAGRAATEPLDGFTRAAVASVVAEALAEGAPKWFEVAPHGDGPASHRPLCLLLTQHAVDQMADAETRAELARPRLLPMLMPPVPWEYVAANPRT